MKGQAYCDTHNSLAGGVSVAGRSLNPYGAYGLQVCVAATVLLLLLLGSDGGSDGQGEGGGGALGSSRLLRGGEGSVA